MFLRCTVLLMIAVTICGCCRTRDCGPGAADGAIAVVERDDMYGGVEFVKAAIRDSLKGKRRRGPSKAHSTLVLTSGGQFGAYSAGFLNGWAEAADGPKRPDDFDVVTGVSTGALVAPFAYMGDRPSGVMDGEKELTYLELIEALYRDIDSDDIFSPRLIRGLLFGDALTSTEPLRQLVSEVITEEFVEAVGKEFEASERLLVVGAVSLYLGRMVYFDLGEIASSDKEDRVELFRSAILASAAPPVVFEPVEIGDYLYVDGGAVQGAFIPLIVDEIREACPADIDRQTFVLLNGYAGLTPECVDACVPQIGGRSIAIILKQSMCTAINGIKRATEEGNGEFYMSSPARGCSMESENVLGRVFDKAFMNCLAVQGGEHARSGTSWEEDAPDCLN